MAAAIRVQTTGNDGGTAAVSGTLTGVQSGDLLTVQFRERDGVSITSVSDTVNGAWTLAVTRAVTAARAGIYYFEGSAAGNPVVTVQFSGSSQPSDAVFIAWSGVEASGALDTTNSGGNSGTTTHSPGAITPSASSLVLTVVATGSDHGGETQPSGFTDLPPDGGATSNRQAYAYKVGHTGSVTASTTTTNAVNSDAVVAAFLESAGGGGGGDNGLAWIRA